MRGSRAARAADSSCMLRSVMMLSLGWRLSCGGSAEVVKGVRGVNEGARVRGCEGSMIAG